MSLVYVGNISALPVHSTAGIVISDFIQDFDQSTVDSVYMTWNVNISSAFSVKYRVTGSTGDYVEIPSNGVLSLTHAFIVANLEPSKSYEIVIETGGVTDTLIAETKAGSTLANSIVVTFPAADGSTVLGSTITPVEWEDYSFVTTVGYDVLIRPDVPFTDQYDTTGVIFDSNGLGAQQDLTGQEMSIPKDGKTYYGVVIGNYRVDGQYQDTQSIFDDGRYGLFSFQAAPATTTTPDPVPTGQAFTAAKAGFDLALSRESSWYSTGVVNLRGRPVTEAYYHRIQAFHALVIAYEVTGQVSYLQKGVDLAMAYVNEGSNRDGDGYHDWLWGHKTDPNRINHDHYEWRSASGIAAIAAAVHDANAAGISVTPSDALSKMTAMLETHMWEKWSTPNHPTGKSFIQGTTGSGGNSRISTIAMALHQITGKSQYSSFLNGRPTEMIETMLASYQPATNSMDINVRTNGASFSYDVSHAEDVIMMLDHARRHGYTFGGRVDATFYQRLADTLKNVMWTGQYLTYRVDGSGNGGQTNGADQYVTNQVCGWSLLTLHDATLFQKALNHANTDPTITDSTTSTVTHERRMILFAALMRSAVVFD